MHNWCCRLVGVVVQVLSHPVPGARQSHSHALILYLALVGLVRNELLLDDGLGCAHYVFLALQSLGLDERLAVVVRILWNFGNVLDVCVSQMHSDYSL